MKRLFTVCAIGTTALLVHHAAADAQTAAGMMGVLPPPAPTQAASPMGIAPAPAPMQPAQSFSAPPQNASLQMVTVICKAPDLSAGASFSYRLDYMNFTVTTPAGAVRPVTMSAQEITWDDTGPDGAVKNTLQRYSGQLTQVKAAQTFTFSCQPG